MQREVAFGGAGADLACTITVPRGGAELLPGVVLIAGSARPTGTATACSTGCGTMWLAPVSRCSPTTSGAPGIRTAVAFGDG